MKYFFFNFLLTIPIWSFANDGAYRGSGNHLIPINETDIRVQKEILSLKKIGHDQMQVSVYYEFFNPKEGKDITVGFEAFAPQGDVQFQSKNGGHPYMSGFTVEMNNQILSHEISYIQSPEDIENGKIAGKPLQELEKQEQMDEAQFYYVYHFNAAFKPGLNIIKHNYTYALSDGICSYYNFNYVLKATMRWGNQQIDDFTLTIDPGEFETFDIKNSFFNSANEWFIHGLGKIENTSIYQEEYTRFHIKQGMLIFHQKNFRTKGDLYLNANYCDDGALSKALPHSYFGTDVLPDPKSAFERKCYRNLPFARRGYLFNTPELDTYFRGMPWYIPLENYIPNLDELHEEERIWIKKWE